jgi:hypothetical protein
MEKSTSTNRGKTSSVSQQKFTILGVFTNAVGYLMERFTLAGGLQDVYIGGDNDPYQAYQGRATGSSLLLA